MMNQIITWIKQRWRLLFVTLIPLVFLPLPVIQNNPEAKCGYIVLILTIYWVFEVIPLAVTAILPLIFFPVSGILSAEEVALCFFRDITALFFGSLALAYAIESIDLHHRVGLFVLSIVGTSAKWAMAGLMGVTAFLSMWINNTAATSIMLPVAIAISNEIERYSKEYQNEKNNRKESAIAVNIIETSEEDLRNDNTLETNETEQSKTELSIDLPNSHTVSNDNILLFEKKYCELRKGFVLCIAYSATIGGFATIVGTAPNIFVKGFVENTYKDMNFQLTFLNFSLLSFPISLLLLILCWLWLQIFFNREELFQWKIDCETRVIQTKLRLLLIKQYKDLGKPQWSEYCVGTIFILMIVLWLTKRFGDIRGWDSLFREKFVTEATVAVFCGILPLILPNSNPFQRNWKYAPIVQWNNLIKNMSWNVVFLIGAGLSIASAFTTSGLSKSVAEALRFMINIPRNVVILLIITISGLFTEVTSNLSTATIFLPVLDSIARSSGTHPAYFILPCILAVSLAFMLPIATAPNAIVFSSGAIRVIDMVKTGIAMNVMGILIVFLASITWMPKIFGLDDQTTISFFSANTTYSP